MCIANYPIFCSPFSSPSRASFSSYLCIRRALSAFPSCRLCPVQLERTSLTESHHHGRRMDGEHQTKQTVSRGRAPLPFLVWFLPAPPAPAASYSLETPAKTLRRACGQPLLPYKLVVHLHHRRRPKSNKLVPSSVPPRKPLLPLPFGKSQQRVEVLGWAEVGTMAAGRGFSFLLVLAALLVGVASASPFLSDGVFQASAGSTRRSLLQAEKSCPINFEFQNYTIITSKCKAPNYPPTECCGAFKEFACPFSTYINDESNNCASTMWTYINLNGKYPPALFSSECRDDKLGVSCEGVPQKEVESGGQRAQSSLLALVILMCGLVALLFH